ncbi:hypothetical protein CK203_095785 [Vitis vinifera]|uniref:Uncharacterized protein n=1 Tax=Vitis vinifera TaxID=29760 RepID=A0A438DL82_VITVI|nr:hypothetical protein CK203_095785 [Vitis vinifera]
MSSSMKQLLETMCEGDFMSTNLEEAMDFLSYVAEVSRRWDEPNAREVGRMKSQPNAPNVKAGSLSGGVSYDSNCEKCLGIKQMLLDNLSPITMLHIATPTIQIRGIIRISLGSQGHLVHATWPSTSQASNLKQAIVNLSKVMGDFVGDQKSINAQLSQRIDSCKRKESFLLNLIRIPRVSMKWRLRRENLQVREVKVVITLRSGKEVDLPTSKPEHEPESEQRKKEEEIKGKRKENMQRRRTLNLLNGVMQLMFGNMTLELNIFYLCKKQFHPEEEEGPEEVCMIDNLVEEHCDQKMLKI